LFLTIFFACVQRDFLRATLEATNAPANVPPQQKSKIPPPWARITSILSLKIMGNKTTRSTASNANMIGQSFRKALGLPRDKRNWQIKKYAVIKMNAAAKPTFPKEYMSASPRNIKSKKLKKPRKNAIKTFSFRDFIKRAVNKSDRSYYSSK
jgi:hypothetical protein